jgi:hypothetical protein
VRFRKLSRRSWSGSMDAGDDSEEISRSVESR